MLKKYFFPEIDGEVQKLIDENSTKNIENVSIVVAVFEMITLALFVCTTKSYGRAQWVSVGSVMFCIVTCLAGYFMARYILKKENPTHLEVITFKATYYLLMSVWGIWSSYRQYILREQMLTFYAVELAMVCFIALKIWLGITLTCGVYFIMYIMLFVVDGAAGINILNYIVLVFVSVIGMTVRYHSFIRMGEATVKLRKAKDLEVQDKINVLKAIADIYDNVNLIDFIDNTEMSVRDEGHVKTPIDLQKQTHTVMSRRIRERVITDQLESFIKFTNIATIRSRLAGKRIISADFIDVVDGWFRAQYIPVEVDENGIPIRVVFTTRNVDEERKREERLVRIAMTDELTNLFNRRCYEEDHIEYAEHGMRDDFVILCADVNGLKKVNDTVGHAAGDELIKGAAESLLIAIGQKGKVYRTGGDEFIAMIHTDDPDAVCRDIENQTGNWKGTYSDKLSVSIGYASHGANKDLDIHELEKKADDAMYRAKARYYEKNGIDRRHH